MRIPSVAALVVTGELATIAVAAIGVVSMALQFVPANRRARESSALAASAQAATQWQQIADRLTTDLGDLRAELAECEAKHSAALGQINDLAARLAAVERRNEDDGK